MKIYGFFENIRRLLRYSVKRGKAGYKKGYIHVPVLQKKIDTCVLYAWEKVEGRYPRSFTEMMAGLQEVCIFFLILGARPRH